MNNFGSKLLDFGAFWLVVFLAYTVVGFLRGRRLVRAFWWSLHRGDERDR